MLPSTASSISASAPPSWLACADIRFCTSRSASSRERTEASCKRYLPDADLTAATFVGAAGAAVDVDTGVAAATSYPGARCGSDAETCATGPSGCVAGLALTQPGPSTAPTVDPV